MILIISEETDKSTDIVIYWLISKGINFLRLNPSDRISIRNLQFLNGKVDFDIFTEHTAISFSDIDAVFYRRGFLNIDDIKFHGFDSNIKDLEHFLKMEITILTNFIHYALERKKSIGNYSKRSINKLETLYLASYYGLKTPATWILSKREELSKLPDQLITKNLFEPISFKSADYSVSSPTFAVNKEQECSESFLYSLFQSKIEKLFELRIFFFKNMFFAGAMFTQANPKTRVDFRNYDDEKPTRIIPFELPNYIREKLLSLTAKIGLDTGSIDMIYSTDCDYYFLEINPVGQFGMVSYPCNYHIEKQIAEYLIP